MNAFKPTYVRPLSAFRKEAAAAIKGHWPKSLLITLLTTLIMLLPAAAFIIKVAYTPMPAHEYYEVGVILDFYAQIFVFSILAALAAFLLSPIHIVSQNKLSVGLLSGDHPALRALLPSPREWARSLRVSILGWIYSMWPFLLGMAVTVLLMQLFIDSANTEGMAALSSSQPLEALLSIPMYLFLPSYALMIYSFTRYISYMPAQYLLVLFPDSNARTLLKTSRRIIKGHKGRFFLLSLSFIGWFMLSSLVPSLLGSLSADLLHPNILSAVTLALTTLFTLPLLVYMNTSLAAFVMYLPCDK